MTESNVEGMPTVDNKTWGKNLLYIARDGQYLGFLTIQDPIRPGMKKTLNRMRRLGIDEVVMLTGDSKDVAAEVAQDMDIDSYYAEILPEEKANYVMKMQKRGNVMMVGDGINDAPALAFSDIGVSSAATRPTSQPNRQPLPSVQKIQLNCMMPSISDEKRCGPSIRTSRRPLPSTRPLCSSGP